MYTIEIKESLNSVLMDAPGRLTRSFFLVVDLLKVHGAALDGMHDCGSVENQVSVFAMPIPLYPAQQMRMFLDEGAREIFIVGIGVERPPCDRALMETREFFGL